MITTCKHCNERFDGGVEIIGQPGARLASLLHKLGSHMNTKHPELAQGMGVIGADFMGWLFLANFKSTDEKLNLYCDQRRWHIHQQTLAARFSDESLREQCAALAETLLQRIRWTDSDHIDLDATAHQFTIALLESFTSVRDALEEPHRYSTVEQPAVVV